MNLHELPVWEFPRETDEYILEAALEDGEETTDVEVGLAVYGVRPVATWTGWPGPKVPTTQGHYLVMLRKDGVAEYVAILRVT